MHMIVIPKQNAMGKIRATSSPLPLPPPSFVPVLTALKVPKYTKVAVQMNSMRLCLMSLLTFDASSGEGFFKTRRIVNVIMEYCKLYLLASWRLSMNMGFFTTHSNEY